MDEARARNYALTQMHGRLPSYALWNMEDVERETLGTRWSWWNALAHETSVTVIVESMRLAWMERLDEERTGIEWESERGTV